MGKDRKTYTADEAKRYIEERATAGRKGLKLQRINMSFAPSVYNYIKVMSSMRGESMTEFVNALIIASMDHNAEAYAKAQEVLQQFDIDPGRVETVNTADPDDGE